MREGFCPKCENIMMIGDVSENSSLHCGQCNEEFLISEWLRKYDKDLIRRVNSLRESADSELGSRSNYSANTSNPLLCGACGEINIVDITEDNHIHCKCGAIYEVSPQLAATANSRLQGSGDINSPSFNYPIETSNLQWLPSAFYWIGLLGLFVFCIIAYQAKSGYVFGYGIGAMLSCFATGRVIELLQIIADELYRKRLSESP